MLVVGGQGQVLHLALTGKEHIAKAKEDVQEWKGAARRTAGLMHHREE